MHFRRNLWPQQSSIVWSQQPPNSSTSAKYQSIVALTSSRSVETCKQISRQFQYETRLTRKSSLKESLIFQRKSFAHDQRIPILINQNYEGRPKPNSGWIDWFHFECFDQRISWCRESAEDLQWADWELDWQSLTVRLKTLESTPGYARI